ncbi:MAG: vWA domain-containing protein [Bacteroidota bacterium]
MNQHLTRGLGCIAMLFLLASCQNYNALVPVLEGKPAGGVLGSTYLSHTQDELSFEVELFAANHVGSFIKNLEPENFSISQTSLTISIDELTFEKADEENSYSVGLLFDQSGSIQTTDPLNARVEGGKVFVESMNSGDEACLAKFAGSRFNLQSDLLSGFTNDGETLIPFIENLAGNEGGGTPLYQGIEGLIDYVSTNASNTSNKVVITFSDGGDTEGGVSIANLIQKAQREDIRIFNIGLGGGVNNQVLIDIAQGTEGANMFVEDALQLISIYGSLGKLLNGSAEFYKLKMKARNTLGPWASGGSLQTNIVLDLPQGESITYPIKISIP